MVCTKDAFPTKADAVRWLHTRAYANRRTGQIPIRAYKCPSCKKWHVTSKPRGKRQ